MAVLVSVAWDPSSDGFEPQRHLLARGDAGGDGNLVLLSVGGALHQHRHARRRVRRADDQRCGGCAPAGLEPRVRRGRGEVAGVVQANLAAAAVLGSSRRATWEAVTTRRGVWSLALLRQHEGRAPGHAWVSCDCQSSWCEQHGRGSAW